MPKASVRSARLSAEDRREKIIESAAFVFADRGFAGATTALIAQRAGISEALLYRHFKSKAALFRAVLRRLTRQQDIELQLNVGEPKTTLDYVRNIRNYLTREMAMLDGTEGAIGHRLLTASLAGDGIYARLIFRRALRHRRPMLAAALEQARKEGLASKLAIDPINSFFLTSHVGLMLAMTRLSGKLAPYGGGDEKVLRDALIFCTRGIGISDTVVEELYREETAARLAADATA
jgi:AcrR family transcriptional regulator